MSSRGQLFVISAPAGTGKTTLVEKLVKDFPALKQSISYTTRKPREGEVSGVHYFFVTPEAFQKRIEAQDFLEHVTLYGDSYGTSKSQVNQELEKGNSLVLVIDTQGAMKLKGKVDATFIFISPPSLEVLRMRLLKRKSEPQEKMEERLKVAEHEIKKRFEYDYEVINDDLEMAYQKLKKIVRDKMQTQVKQITNEKLKTRFESPFELVGYAITLVGNMVSSGRAPRVKSTVENPAVWALDEILQGKDVLDDLPEDVPHVETVVEKFPPPVEEIPLRHMEKRKPRRILQ